MIETKRTSGKVLDEHISSLGSVDIVCSVRDRLIFWTKVHERLAKLDNRLDAEAKAKIFGAIHARVPMVIPEEQRSLQLESVRAEEKLWSFLREHSAEQIEGYKALIRSTENAVASRQALIGEAETEIAAANKRIEQVERGEAVAGGFDKPIDFEMALRKAGWTTTDLKHLRLWPKSPRRPSRH